MSKIKAYLAGDMLKRGSQLLRAIERDAIEKFGHIKLFNPMDNKEINDKSKNPTAEMIFEKDTQAILDAEIVIAEIDNNNVGTTCEMGQIWGINYMLDRIQEIFDTSNEHWEVTTQLEQLMRDIPYKRVMWQTTDIRDTDIPEAGHRRSHSLNQYLHGMMLDMAGDAKKFDDILEELQQTFDGW